MPVPSLQGLQTALSGLIANQEALDVTGENIANEGTVGYSRQEAITVTSPSIRIMTSSGHVERLGTGVGVTSIQRVRNTHLDAEYRTQNTSLGRDQALRSQLEQVQSAFDEPSETAISGQLSAFWGAWGELAQSPSDAAAREAVVSTGTGLAHSLNELSAQISAVTEQAQAQYAAIAGPGGEVAGDASQLALLNQQIKLAEQGGQSPNELLDARDEILDQLSGLASITVTEGAYGTDTVTFGDAAEPLVEGTTVNWPQTLTREAGGELGALLELTEPEGILAGYGEALDEVAAGLSASVNALQPESPFFSGTTAATITVVGTPTSLQTSSGGAAGGNDLAIAISELRGGTAEQGYAALVESVGSGVRSAGNDETTARAVVGALEEQRQGVSGVSLDEEMTRMVSFQNGYQASARVLTAMDQMLEQLIEHTGVAGL